MGSIDAACISGFLCRLCSEMHRTVIHIYGDQGRRFKLAQKINDYLPVTITPSDPLPKTICETCMRRVEQHHTLMVTMAKNSAKFALRRQQALQQRNSTTTTTAAPSVILLTTTNTRNTNSSVANNETTTSTAPRLTDPTQSSPLPFEQPPIEILSVASYTADGDTLHTIQGTLIENRDETAANTTATAATTTATATVATTPTITAPTIVINNNNNNNNNIDHDTINDNIFESSENETIFDIRDSEISSQISTNEQTENTTTTT